ncbi:MAG: 3-isopropylmalate dehydratase small subunit [Bacteroidota bacterium]|nr:3-isopropylmalate dehydratase small subunit [Candidatus Kapabacteria bacterium]MDW8219560.1 3-isopropylmalate dehydratase small subunit [Bacteroidota bacterium]
MEQYTAFQSHAAPLPIENIDTDQIIPARFLKITDISDIGSYLFYDWRYADDGSPRPEFILNQSPANTAQILVAGSNFGCGSSREHAPWALKAFGFRAIVSSSFADIFRNNALKNGLLPIVVESKNLHTIFSLICTNPQALFRVDLERQILGLPDGTEIAFPIEAFSKHCLLNGVDELGYILRQEPSIIAYERMHHL